MRKIKIQYPQKSDNRVYDGKIHEALIEEIYQIGDKPLFLMHYCDINLQLSMCTILLNKNGSFYEMPLNNYANLGTKIREYGLKKIDETFITPFVQLGNFVDIEKLLNYNYNTNSYMVKPTYVSRVSKQKRK